MANKVDRILESIKATTGIDSYNSIVSACGILDLKATPNKQAKYVKKVIEKVKENQGKDVIEKVMKPCGYQCISNSIIDKVKKLHEKSNDIDEFLHLLNEQHIGGGQLHTKDGKIIGVYSSCYCGLAKQSKDMSPAYCYCSAGWFEKLFSSILGDSVKVNKVQSILDGSDKCIFEITI
ncbi:DUF6144 family protein [Proteiniborus sp. MB09-C3]|uniref:DUF6144 family protein n=1 Tax=Proteiniborus sp. MB09-C3 TaxID=3050072 RepID=UPI002554A48E|nr:DUF6144 family protein [Proteiniborus sp. MB09-C3]WIV12394.1 DUF6144 family protein [Proteiniborus sp. MB09-C3]